MSEGKRPGGLTTLAVLNFIAVAWDGLQTLNNGFLFVASRVEQVRELMLKPYEGNKEMLDIMTSVLDNGAFFGAMALFYAGLTVTLLLAGIGYLQQKKFLGRKIGNTYALLSIASLVFYMTQMPEFPTMQGAPDPAQFNMLSIIAGIYPVLTLILLNTTFKEDFVR